MPALQYRAGLPGRKAGADVNSKIAVSKNYSKNRKISPKSTDKHPIPCAQTRNDVIPSPEKQMAKTLQFRIQEWASSEDVARWDCQPGDEVEFQITRESGFRLLTTGIAISAVRRVRSKASAVIIRCEFPFPRGEIHTMSMKEWPDFFLTLIGVALLEAADTVVDANSRDLSANAFDCMWRQILLKTGGIVGDGKSQNLISREFDSPIPELVRSSETNKLPSRREFESALGNIGEGLGAGKRFFGSLTEAAISGFLFEAFRNSIEHAIPEYQGIWGVSVEKLVLQSFDNLSQRNQIPAFLRSFIEPRFQRRNSLWLCATVADYGQGIQNTLLPSGDESEWSRLMRAFERGTSRKPRSGSPNRGQGLANILDAAARLQACIFVNSAGQAAFNETKEGQSVWSRIEIPTGLQGTAISVFWPVSNENPDQEVLNLGL